MSALFTNQKKMSNSIQTLVRQFKTLEDGVSSNSFKAYTLLAYIMATDPNPVFIHELVKINGTGSMRTSKLVKALAEDGLVQVTPSPTDSRKREVTLTNKGRALAKDLNGGN